MTPHVLFLSALLLTLGVIVYQDIRYRSVPVYVFAAAGALALLIQYQRCGIDAFFFIQLLLNSGFIALNLLIVWFYVKKVKRMPLRNAIGLGDLAFYIIMIPLLSTPVYVYFHLTSLLLILCSYPLLKNVLSLHTRAIPLAGLQALCLMVTILLFENFILNKPILGSCSIIYWI